MLFKKVFANENIILYNLAFTAKIKIEKIWLFWHFIILDVTGKPVNNCVFFDGKGTKRGDLKNTSIMEWKFQESIIVWFRYLLLEISKFMKIFIIQTLNFRNLPAKLRKTKISPGVSWKIDKLCWILEFFQYSKWLPK